MPRSMRIPSSAVALLAALTLAGCAAPDAGFTPQTVTTSPTASAASPTPAAPVAPDGSVLAGTATLTDDAGARLKVLMVAEEPVDGKSGAADPLIYRLMLSCPGEYDDATFNEITAEIMRVDVEVVAESGTWDPASAFALRPAAADSPTLGVGADGTVTATGDATTPHCRRGVTMTGVGSAHLYLVLTGEKAVLDWRTLRFGVSPASGAAFRVDDCRFALRAGVAGTVTTDTSAGCLATVTP